MLKELIHEEFGDGIMTAIDCAAHRIPRDTAGMRRCRESFALQAVRNLFRKAQLLGIATYGEPTN